MSTIPFEKKWCKHLLCLHFSFSLDPNHIIFTLLSVFLQDNCRDSQRGKNCYIMLHCTRICLSWMRTRLCAPSFNISIISCDPFDPMLCPLIYRAALRNDCKLWRLRLLSMWVASSSYCNLDSYISFKFVLTLQFTPSPLVYHTTPPPPPPHKETHTLTHFSSLCMWNTKCQFFDNIWPHFHMVYLDCRHRLPF